jgi:hypothetical protein
MDEVIILRMRTKRKERRILRNLIEIASEPTAFEVQQ